MEFLRRALTLATDRAYDRLIENHLNDSDPYTLPDCQDPGDLGNAWFAQFGEDLAKYTTEGEKVIGFTLMGQIGPERFAHEVIVQTIRNRNGINGAYHVTDEVIFNPNKEN